MTGDTVGLKDHQQQNIFTADHDFLSQASVCCLEHKEWSDSTRKLRESYWIRRLNTLCPFGMTAWLSKTDLALKVLFCSKIPVISRLFKYKLCPPPLLSRELLSCCLLLVDPYLYESISEVKHDLPRKFSYECWINKLSASMCLWYPYIRSMLGYSQEGGGGLNV